MIRSNININQVPAPGSVESSSSPPTTSEGARLRRALSGACNGPQTINPWRPFEAGPASVSSAFNSVADFLKGLKTLRAGIDDALKPGERPSNYSAAMDKLVQWVSNNGRKDYALRIRNCQNKQDLKQCIDDLFFSASPSGALQAYQRLKYNTIIYSETVENLPNNQRISIPISPNVKIDGAYSQESREEVKKGVGKYLEKIGCKIVKKYESPSRLYFLDAQGKLHVMTISATRRRYNVGEVSRDKSLREQPYLLSAVLSPDGRSIYIVKTEYPIVREGNTGLQGPATDESHHAATMRASAESRDYDPEAVATPLMANLAIDSSTQSKTQADLEYRGSHYQTKHLQRLLEIGRVFVGTDRQEKLLDLDWLKTSLHLVIEEACSSSSVFNAAKNQGNPLPPYGPPIAKIVATGINQGVAELLHSAPGSSKKDMAERLANIWLRTRLLTRLADQRGVVAVQPLVRAICIEVPKKLKAAGAPDLGAVEVIVKKKSGDFVKTSLAAALEHEPWIGQFDPTSRFVSVQNPWALLQRLEDTHPQVMERAKQGELRAAEDRQRIAEQRLMETLKQKQRKAESRRHLAAWVAGETLALQKGRDKREYDKMERDSRLSEATHKRVKQFEDDRRAGGETFALTVAAIVHAAASPARAEKNIAAASGSSQSQGMLAQASASTSRALPVTVQPPLPDASALPMVAATAMPGTWVKDQTVYVPAIRVDDSGGRYPGEFQAKQRPGAPSPTVILPPPPPPTAYIPSPAGRTASVEARLPEWKPSEVKRQDGYTAIPFTRPDMGRLAVAFPSEALDLSFHHSDNRKTVIFQPAAAQSSKET